MFQTSRLSVARLYVEEVHSAINPSAFHHRVDKMSLDICIYTGAKPSTYMMLSRGAECKVTEYDDTGMGGRVVVSKGTSNMEFEEIALCSSPCAISGPPVLFCCECATDLRCLYSGFVALKRICSVCETDLKCTGVFAGAQSFLSESG